jgi:hypothetical protein
MQHSLTAFSFAILATQFVADLHYRAECGQLGLKAAFGHNTSIKRSVNGVYTDKAAVRTHDANGWFCLSALRNVICLGFAPNPKTVPGRHHSLDAALDFCHLIRIGQCHVH